MIADHLSSLTQGDLDNSLGALADFQPGPWQQSVDLRDFIQRNYTPYTGDGTFLAAATPRTETLWGQVKELMALEREKGVLDADTAVPSGITSHAPGYIDVKLEQIVGLQTDRPLKRAIMPFGGIRVVEAGLNAYGYELDPGTKVNLYPLPQNPQRRRIRRLHRRNAPLPQVRHHHRAARCLWARPDHRRLSAGGAVRVRAHHR